MNLYKPLHFHQPLHSHSSFKMRPTQIFTILSAVAATAFAVDLRHLVIPPSGVALEDFCADWLSTCQEYITFLLFL